MKQKFPSSGRQQQEKAPSSALIRPTRVMRISRGTFDSSRFAEVEQMTQATAAYLIPAIRKLPGLVSYFAGASPDGSIVHVSIWDTKAHAAQMGSLKEMTVDARRDAEQAGVTFLPIVTYPVAWNI
jgi:hypothetical protein